MRNEKVQSVLLACVGGYILYLAYQLFEKYRTGTNEMPEAAFILSIAVLFIGGIATIVFAWRIYQKQRTKDDSDPDKNNEPGCSKDE